MADDRLNVTLRPMTVDDIDQVVVLDRLSFPTPWPAHTYRHEIISNRTSTMIVLEATEPAPGAPGNGASGSLLGRLIGRRPSSAYSSYPLLGYSGFWKIADEAHISTIAVHPDWRGHKLGELLVWAMFHLAMQQDAAMVTLEVRVSNDVAINLYRKYGFEVTGRRRNYYRDNQEDAHVMTAQPFDYSTRSLLRRFERDLARRLHVTFIDLPLETEQAYLSAEQPPREWGR